MENKSPLLAGFKLGDDIVLQEYVTEVKQQAREKESVYGTWW